MRGKIDISQLSEEEYWNVVRVITKDVAIRKAEQDRIKFLQKQFEDTRRAVMVKSVQKSILSCDEHCLICGAALLTYCCIFYRGAECVSCEHVVCPKCRRMLLGTDDNAVLCLLCVKKRELKRKSCEWFYEAVEKKFKRFGSAKILRAICKQKEKVDHQFVTLLAVVRELSFGSGRKYSVARPITSLFKEDIVLSGRLQKSTSSQKVTRTVSSPEFTSVSEAEDVLLQDFEIAEDALGASESPHATLAQRLSLPTKTLHHCTDDLKAIEEIEYKELVVLSSATKDEELTVVPTIKTSVDRSEGCENEAIEVAAENPGFRVNIINEIEFIAVGSVAFVLSLFLSILASLGYLDDLLESEKEDQN